MNLTKWIIVAPIDNKKAHIEEFDTEEYASAFFNMISMGTNEKPENIYLCKVEKHIQVNADGRKEIE